MRRIVRRIGQRAALIASLVLAASALASAQEPLFAPPTAVAFIPRYDWNMSAALLADPDPRFTWDTHWKGDFDLVTVPRGRGSFLIDYQALCGSEYRPFDPYQGNYVLEGAGSVFAGRTEIAGVFRHVSRHLSDRPKRGAVADNSRRPAHPAPFWRRAPIYRRQGGCAQGDCRILRRLHVDRRCRRGGTTPTQSAFLDLRTRRRQDSFRSMSRWPDASSKRVVASKSV